MLIYGFSHNFGNGHTLKRWFVKDKPPTWYVDYETFKDKSIRIVASAGDNFRNDLKSMKEAHKFLGIYGA